MRLSPILGLPIAEPEDFATSYPVEIDEPRTMALDSKVITGDAGNNADYIPNISLQFIRHSGSSNSGGDIVIPFLHQIIFNHYTVVTCTIETYFNGWHIRIASITEWNVTCQLTDPGAVIIPNAGVIIHAMVAAQLA